MNRKPKNRKNKVHLVFDEAKRKEFLTGFHKRKLQRKKKAQEELEQLLKEEKKRLKSEAKEMYKKMTVSHRPIPELEHLLKEEYEDENVNVKVLELSSNNISNSSNHIGANQMEFKKEQSDDKDEEQVPGMELKRKKAKVDHKQEFKSEKHLKREIRKQATKKVQKSKIFQRKNKIERVKMRKKAFQKKKLIEKHDTKKTKRKHK